MLRWHVAIVWPGLNIICGVIYRQHNSVDRFLDYFEEAVDRYSATGKPICLLGDANINILRAQTCNYAQQFLDCLQSYALLPTIDKPTRVYNSATLIDNIFTDTLCECFASGNIVSDITDHFFQYSAYFNLLLKQLSLPKLLFETTRNTLSRDFYRIWRSFATTLGISSFWVRCR